MDCQYHKDGKCSIAGELAGTDAVRVTVRMCRVCSDMKDRPRQKNGVTASAAIRHLRKLGDEHYSRRRHEIMPYIDNAKCGRRPPPASVATLEDADRKLLLKCRLAPGDVMTMTAAVRSLHAAYPGKYRVDVDTTCMPIWENNPDIETFGTEERQNAFSVDMHYPMINESNQRLQPFLAGYTEFLGSVLGLHIPLMCSTPQLHLSEQERGWISQVGEMTGRANPRYWVINAGSKSDFTAKQWPVEYFQEVVNATRHRWEWVQIGECSGGHNHPDLEGVINLRGKTTPRQLFRLVYHSLGALGPVTFLQHVAAALKKPYICLLGGREPVPWVQYPLQQTLHTVGQLDCCKDGACWKTRVVPLKDAKDNGGNSCLDPCISWKMPVARCMTMIRPEDVIQTMQRYQ